jgi:hypothetical protein
MKKVLLVLVVVLITVAVACNDQKITLTLDPSSLPAGGGQVKVTYKTEGFLSTVPFTLVANPPQSGFPITWTGNMGQSPMVTVTKTTTFTITDAPAGTDVKSATVSVP